MRDRLRRFAALIAVGAFAGATVVTGVATPASAAGGSVTGTVFRDYNGNGRMDTAGGSGVQVDVGVGSVAVEAFDSTGASVATTTTAANGTYTLTVAGAATTDLRVEFSGFPAGFEPSINGTLGGTSGATTVQFVSIGDTGVNLGIQVPEEHAQGDAPLVTPIQRAGKYNDASVSSLAALAALPWSAGYSTTNGQAANFPGRVTLATTGQVGAIWGTAFQGTTNSLYAAATLKRHSGLGPLGIGGIYRVSGVLASDGTLSGATTVDQWLDVDGMPIAGGGTVDVGSVNSDAYRGLTNATSPGLDLEGFTNAGEVGIGGIAVSTDQRTLYFINLYDRKLYSIDISDPASVDSSTEATQYDLGLSGDQRPWALTVYRDQVYVGYVDSGESQATPTSASSAGMAAHLIRADENGDGTLGAFSGDMLNLSLGYTKGLAGASGGPSSTVNMARWNSWTDSWSWSPFGSTDTVELTWWGKPAQIFPQPILSDLQFDADGYLMLGFADRTSLQGGNRNYAAVDADADNAADDTTTFYEPAASGDLLLAYETSPGVFSAESAGAVGSRTTSVTGGTTNASGPGGGEFFQDQNSLGTSNDHRENTLGGLGLLFGIDEVVSTSYDPLAPVRVAGINWYAPSDGQVERGYIQTLDNSDPTEPRRSPDGTFQKGGGLGDLETLAEVAPLEIGNRVWLDSDGDGVQDAGEPGIDGVTVQLLDASNTVVGTAVTSGGGEYYFSTAVTEAAAGDGDNIGGGLDYYNDVTVRVGIAADYGSGGALEGLILTTEDAAADDIDSDPATGVGTLGSAWFPLIPVDGATLLPGDNNHTYDAGFTTPPVVPERDLALRKTVVSATGPLASGTVTFNLRVFNQGSGDVGSVTLTDYINGDQFAPLLSAQDVADTTATGSGNAIAIGSWSASTGSDPTYASQITLTGVLEPGDFVDVPITLDVDIAASALADAIANGLDNYAEISVFDTDSDAGNGDSSTGAVYDVDSIPDANPSNDGTVEDDVIDEQAWTNTASSSTGPTAGQDEDDHDVATIPLYDLALIKERASGQEAHITSAAPATVNFDITVKNQGANDAYNIHVQDYLASGLAFGTNATQVVSGHTVTYVGSGEFVIDGLAPDESLTFPVVTTASPTTQNVLVNTAEITAFDNTASTGDTIPAWVVDFDSTPDTNSSNDATDGLGSVFTVDNSNDIDLAPVNGINIADEDDHDTEGVTFALMRLGSTVYIDGSNGGTIDGVGEFGEGVEGVLVQLRDSGGTVIAEDVTDANGDYWFTGLFPGTYTVGIPAVQDAIDNSLDASIVPGALDYYEPVAGSVANPEDLNFDNDGDAESGWLSLSDNVVLTYDGELADNAADTSRAPGTYADANSNLNIDFVFDQILYEFGNLVWLDANDNGIADSGESGIDGVRVELWLDVDSDGVFEPTGDDSTGYVGYDDTAGGGYYDFAGLPAGDYFAHIDDQSALNGRTESSVTVGDADADVDNDNNAVPDGSNGGWTSGAVTLGNGDKSDEPTGEKDGTTGSDAAPTETVADDRANQTVDFGFVDRVRIGNQVWRDESDSDPATSALTDNNGVFDAASGEVGLAGVTVYLFKDDGDGNFEPGVGAGLDGAAIASTSTDSEGNYWFEGVAAGEDYFVAIQAIGGGFTTPRSSSGQSSAIGDDDNDDDGNPNAGYLSVSHVFTATLGAATTGEVDANPAADGSAETEANAAGRTYADNDSELAVDFGFVDVPLYRIGNRVWLDENENGVFDTGEAPIEGVQVELQNSGGTVIGSTDTDASGYYAFEDLVAGNYRVVIPFDQSGAAVPTALDGLASSAIDAGDPDVDTDDNDDNGIVDAADWRSAVVTLGGAFDGTFGTEPTNEQKAVGDATDDDTGWTSGPDAQSNFTVDFGFVPLYRIGNVVWQDLDNNGTFDTGESGISGVTVQLWVDTDGDGFEGGDDDVLVDTVLTDSSGNYAFEGLMPGDYYVHIPTQAKLDGFTTAGTPVANADGDVDNDNNAVEDGTVGGWTAGEVTLGQSAEPDDETTRDDTATDDDDGTAVGAGADYADNRSNFSVDFGFFSGLRIGNLVWHDEQDSDLSTTSATDNNGEVDAGESVMPGVTVKLYADGGDGTFDAGLGGGDDTYVDTTTTDAEGNYWFEHLPEDDYFVAIQSLPGGFGTMKSSDGRNSGGAAADNNDNGAAATDGAANPYISVSDLITLTIGGEPTGESDALPTADGSAETEANSQLALDLTDDDDSELTVDMGFILVPEYRVGNLVWLDTDRNGTADNGEDGIAGVLVELLDDSGTVIARTVTDSAGLYSFEGLAAGDYRVRIPGVQDDPTDALDSSIISGALSNLISTVDGGAVSTDADNDDNGVIAGANWQSSLFTLGSDTAPYGVEPTTEQFRSDVATDDDSGWTDGTDDRSQFTVDFGFAPGLRIGDTVWLDDGDVAENNGAYVPANEDNGVYDSNEDPIPGVDVELWIDVDGDGNFEPTGDDATGYVGTDTTDSAGEYFFIGVDELNDYFTVIPAGAGKGDGAGNNATLLADLRSSTPASAATTTGNDTDHGDPATGYASVSGQVAPVRGGMTYGDAADEANADTKTGVTLADGDSNLVIDFGFSPVPEYEIGDLVWLDDNDGIAESGETGIPGVTVYLFRNSGSANFEPGGGEEDGLPIATDVTDSNGVYEFTGLPAGDYWVMIPKQSALDSLDSSTVREANANNDVDNDNNGVDFSYLSYDGWAASLVTVGEGDDNSEPTGETDGTTGVSAEDGSVRDDRSNQTIDFGFAQRVRLGNQVWRDESDSDPATEAATDNNGVFDASSGETGLVGVTLQLWHDENGDGFQGPASDDVLVDTTTSVSEGNYYFSNIVPDTDYYVAIPSAPFADARSSAGQSTTVETGDNDDDGAVSGGYIAVSKSITLSISSEPTGEVDANPAADGSAETEANTAIGATYADSDSNLRVDFGFVEVPVYRIGNRVWLDTNNDGVAQDIEDGIPGVLVQLLNAAGDTVLDETVTDSNGYYAFEDLIAGDYRVLIPNDQTEDIVGGTAPTAGALDNLASSTTDATNANDDADNDDNGVDAGATVSPVTAGDALSSIVTLGDADVDAAVNTEPTDEQFRSDNAADDDSGWLGGPDSHSNFSVDFGYYELLRLGDVVWYDDGDVNENNGTYVPANEDNGIFDSNEDPIAGVDVELWTAGANGTFDGGSGDDVYVGTAVTDANGLYYFTGLTEGVYWVVVPAAAGNADGGNYNVTALSGYRSSTGQAANDATNQRDQGAEQSGYAGVSKKVTLVAGGMTQSDSGAEAAANTNTGVTVDDASSLLTIDFGFSPVPTYAIGDLVWYDYNDDGVADSGEPGIPGVDVQLWIDVDNDGVFEPSGDDAAGYAGTDTTDADGRYLFDGIVAGDYFTYIPKLQPELDGFRTSGTPDASADNDQDNDNNGVGSSSAGWHSGAVTLGGAAGPADHDEPTGETDGTTGDDAEAPVSVRDDRSNQTVDFGFWQGLRLGNHVWLDEGAGSAQNNGLLDSDAAEVDIANVDVELWLDGGDNAFDAGTGDDTYIGSTTTNSDGLYYFENLEEGSYWAAVPSVPGGGVQSSTNRAGNAPSLVNDAQDDGEPNGSYLSVSPRYTLAIGGAPTGEANDLGAAGTAETAANSATGTYRDIDSYLTVDFSFIDVPLYRIGNLVWHDDNNDGVAEDGETGIPGVLVQLFDDSDTLIGETVTDASGNYEFTNLAGGDVYVVIPMAQDAVDNSLDPSIDNTALDGFYVSTTTTADANADNDNDNNAAVNGALWQTGTVTLGPDTAGGDPDVEPTDEQLRSDNATDDDAGQASASRIDDDRSNYSVDAGFYSISVGNMVFSDVDNDGVYVVADGDTPIDGVTVNLRLASDDSLVDTTTTTGGGLYLFTGLVDGETYYIEIPASQFDGGALDGYYSSDSSVTVEGAAADGYDHGIDPAALYGAVLSNDFVAEAGGEWTADGTGDNPDNDAIRPDDSEDLTVDFGFYRLELGGNVFWDPQNDGLDDGDRYFEDVTLLLYTGGGAPFLRADGSQATTTTNVDGDYVFTGLPAGDYIVEIPESEFYEELAGLGSSDGNDVAGLAPDPDNDVSGEDNGNPVGGDIFVGAAVRALPVTLAADSEPTSDTGPTAGVVNDNSNRSVDFGFFDVQINLELGNQIWFDKVEDGVYGAGDTPAPAGVVIELWDVTDTSAPYATTTTDGLGQYLFSGLPAGDYYLVLPSSNFKKGGPLYGYVPTDGPGVSIVPDDGTDSDSNGEKSTGFSVRTAVFSFFSQMPTGESEGPYTVTDDRLSDMTIDIGLIEDVLAYTGVDIGPMLTWMMMLLSVGVWLMVADRNIRRERRRLLGGPHATS